jgi:tetratricopeptide (TPR) repeat protein
MLLGRRALEHLWEGGALAIDAFLLPELHALKTEYRRQGNPHIIYLAASSLAREVRTMRGSVDSFQYSRLQGLLAEMLIAQGSNADTVALAIKHLDIAREVLHRVSTLSDDTLRFHGTCALLVGVAKKALGDFDDAIRELRTCQQYLRERHSACDVDLIPLRRQEVMMHQDPQEHRILAAESVHYRLTQPYEFFRSVKRVFEFCLNSGRLDEATELYPLFTRAFKSIALNVEPISKISFLKNLGQYHLARDDVSKATLLLNRAFAEATERNLQGQMRQLRLLLGASSMGGTKPTLMTFSVMDRG